MSQHQYLGPNLIAEQFKYNFEYEKQAPYKHYLAEFCSLSEYFEKVYSLIDMLKDQLV